MSKYRMMKVYNSFDMPEELRKEFLNCMKKCNDVFVSWTVHDSGKCVRGNKGYWYDDIDGEKVPYAEVTSAEILDEWDNGGEIFIIQRGDNKISDWLYDNGAKMGEDVLIEYS